MSRTSLLTLAASLLTSTAALAGPVNNITQTTTHNTIQDAITAAVNGDVIEADPGTYVENINLNGLAITLRSASGDPADTIIDGGAAGSVVFCTSGEGPDTVLEGFTVTNGSFGSGAGMFIATSSPTVTNCVFSNNTLTSAGGSGGAMFVNNASPTVHNCTFIGNTSLFVGGAVSVINAASNPVFANCALSGNASASSGGAVYVFDATGATFTNCILWDNSPSQMFSTSPTTVSYSDIQGGLPAGTIDGGGNIDADPLFADADLRLGPGSPCIDAADSGAYAAAGGGLTDLGGVLRYSKDPGTPDTGVGLYTFLDMGPHEFQGASPSPCPGDLDGDNDTDVFDFSILASDFGCTD